MYGHLKAENKSVGDTVICQPSTTVKMVHLSKGRQFEYTWSLPWKSNRPMVCKMDTHCVSQSVQGCVFCQASTTLITSDLAAETSMYTLPPFPEQPRTLLHSFLQAYTLIYSIYCFIFFMLFFCFTVHFSCIKQWFSLHLVASPLLFLSKSQQLSSPINTA